MELKEISSKITVSPQVTKKDVARSRPKGFAQSFATDLMEKGQISLRSKKSMLQQSLLELKRATCLSSPAWSQTRMSPRFVMP